MKFDVVVIGGGPSGMSASLSASEQGAKCLLIERDGLLGGILNQCIHNGFGLHYFGEELTGPEYAQKLAEKVEKDKNITIMLNTFVCDVSANCVQIINQNGKQDIQTKAVVLAMGCRERTVGAISLVGNRPSGVFTAGSVQKMINHYGKIPGKEAVILGSGDIGLIMCRRLLFEGVKVKAVLEIMPNSAGLARNIRQCVEDFNVPLLFNHTITKIDGTTRVKGVYYAEVDKNLVPIKESEKYLKCDTVLLSVGLIPENDLVTNLLEFDTRTKGAIVDENRQTSTSGIFASGNVLHIHDLADNATIEGQIAGTNAGLYAFGKLPKQNKIDVLFDKNISYILPQKVNISPKPFMLFFRVRNKITNNWLVVKDKEKVLAQKFVRVANPGEMQEIKVENITNLTELNIIFSEVKL